MRLKRCVSICSLLTFLALLTGQASAQFLDRAHLGLVNPLIYGVALNETTLSAAITAIGSAKQGLMCTPGTWTIANNLTIPANIHLVRAPGCILSPNVTRTLTINGSEEGPLTQWLAGAGSVILGAKIPKVYPQWTGALGDGVTDDTAAITASILAVSVTGGSVYFPAGTYLTSLLTIPSNVSLIGDIRGVSTLKLKSGSNSHLIKTAQGAANVGIIGLTLDGNKAGNTGTLMNMFFWDTQGFVVRDVLSVNADGDGLYIGGGSGTAQPSRYGMIDNYRSSASGRNGISVVSGEQLTFVGPVIESAGLCGINLETNSPGDLLNDILLLNPVVKVSVNVGINFNVGAGVAVPRSITVINPTILDTTGSSIPGMATQSVPIKVYGGLITSAAGSGIDISANAIVGALRGTVISGMEIHNNVGSGIRITNNAVPVDGLTIDGNYIHANGLFGINAFGVRYAQIKNNTLRNNTGHAIRLTDATGFPSTDNVIQGNIIYDDQGTPTQTTGIGLIGTSNNNIVFGNRIGATTATPLNLTGTNHADGNLGYQNENSGIAVIASGATSVIVTHGLGYTPTAADVSVVLTTNTTNDLGRYWISGLTSTQFQLNCKNDPGASTAIFGWRARRKF